MEILKPMDASELRRWAGEAASYFEIPLSEIADHQLIAYWREVGEPEQYTKVRQLDDDYSGEQFA